MTKKQMKVGKHDGMLREIPEERQELAPKFVTTVGGYNEDGVIQGIVTGSTSFNSVNQENYSAVGMILFWDVVAQPNTGTVQLFIDARNPATEDYTAIWQSGAINATGTVISHRKYLFYPGAVDDAALFTSVDRIPLPRNWRIRCLFEPEGLDWTFSIGYAYVDS